MAAASARGDFRFSTGLFSNFFYFRQHVRSITNRWCGITVRLGLPRVKTCEIFLCFVAIVWLGSVMLTSFLWVWQVLMYQSKRSFNIPPGNPQGIWIFGTFLFKSPPPWPEKLFKCPTRTFPWGRSAGLFPEQQLVIEPRKLLFIL